jgi:signal transduction histidine kinase
MPNKRDMREDEAQRSNGEFSADMNGESTGRGREGNAQPAAKTEALGIAHDLNNALTVISGNLELVRMTPDVPDAVAGYLAEAMEAVDNAAAMTGRLSLLFAKARDQAGCRKPL